MNFVIRAVRTHSQATNEHIMNEFSGERQVPRIQCQLMVFLLNEITGENQSFSE